MKQQLAELSDKIIKVVDKYSKSKEIVADSQENIA